MSCYVLVLRRSVVYWRVMRVHAVVDEVCDPSPTWRADAGRKHRNIAAAFPTCALGEGISPSLGSRALLVLPLSSTGPAWPVSVLLLLCPTPIIKSVRYVRTSLCSSDRFCFLVSYRRWCTTNVFSSSCTVLGYIRKFGSGKTHRTASYFTGNSRKAWSQLALA